MATTRLSNARLMAWIYSNKATVPVLQQVYAFYGLNHPVPNTLATLQAPIYQHLNGLAAPNAIATWQPTTPATPVRRITPVTPVVTRSFVNTTLPAATEGLAYSHNVATTGFTSPVTYSLLGNLPWIGIDPVTGNLTANPPYGYVGTHTFSLQASDGTNPPTVTPVSLTVNRNPNPVPVAPARRSNQTSIPMWIPLGLLFALLVAAAIWFLAPWLMSLRPAPVAPVYAPITAPVQPIPACVGNVYAIDPKNPTAIGLTAPAGSIVLVETVNHTAHTITLEVVQISQPMTAYTTGDVDVNLWYGYCSMSDANNAAITEKAERESDAWSTGYTVTIVGVSLSLPTSCTETIIPVQPNQFTPANVFAVVETVNYSAKTVTIQYLYTDKPLQASIVGTTHINIWYGYCNLQTAQFGAITEQAERESESKISGGWAYGFSVVLK